MTNDEGLSPAVLRRQLSVTYTHNGVQTSDDPDSYEGEERRSHQKSLLRDHPNTGYADAIVRTTRPTFFQPFARVSDFLETVLDPIITPTYLAFKSLNYLFHVVKNALSFLIDGGFALLVRPFSKKNSEISFNLAAMDFMEMRHNFLRSVIYAVASVLSFIDNFVKLFTRTSASLVEPILGSAEDESTCSMSFNS
ncbi:hypothetical protein [Legionella sp. km772]|uniref:hypothetical protein n=1 Tax=Legionella sp. km772 TaxID=2498111 RepID=UPI0018F32B36|nr:hypothetical protein [Legionella sp. km772]